MRQFIACAFLCSSVLLSAAPVGAEPAVGAGVGTYTCDQFIHDTRADAGKLPLFVSWAQGWMTGWNLAQQDQAKPIADLAAISIPDQQAFLMAYCAAHPKALFMEAAYRLRERMLTK